MEIAAEIVCAGDACREDLRRRSAGKRARGPLQLPEIGTALVQRLLLEWIAGGKAALPNARRRVREVVIVDELHRRAHGDDQRIRTIAGDDAVLRSMRSEIQ